MSDAVDTSAEACRGGVALLRAAMTPLLHSERLRLAHLIDALLAERDAAVAEAARLRVQLALANRRHANVAFHSRPAHNTGDA